VMDADLQDPPEVVLDMIAKWKEGYDVVSAERTSRQGESRFKRATANLFYRLMDRLGDASMPRNVGDFRLVDRRALDCFLAMPERDRFVRGMFAWIGLVSFSDAPLRLALWAGGAVSALAFVYGLSVIGRWALSDPTLERGWSSTIVVIAALGGANMLMTGVIGLYVGRIYAEAKGRPLYVVDRAVGFDAAPAAARAPTRASESGSPRPGRGQAQWS
jgi:hypothetical protein